MTTAPLLNSASLLPTALPAAKAGNANPAQTPFNHVLSKEVAERRDATPPAIAVVEKPAAASPPPAAGRAAAGKIEDDPDGTVPATVSAELLALVADLHRKPDPAAVDSAGLSDSADAAEQPGLTLLLADDLPSGSSKKEAALALTGGKIELPADTAAAPGALSRDAAAAAKQEASFSAALKQAGDAKPASDPNLAKTLDAAATAPNTPALAQFAPAAVHAAQGAAAGGQLADKLTPPVGTPAWDAALGQKVVWMVAGAQQSASLTLNPPDLGPLQVVLHVNNSQANATFISAQPEVRQALEAALPRLREMMNEAGIQLGQANVNSGTPDQSPTFGQAAAQHDRNGRSSQGAPAETVVSSRVPLSGGRGLVDTFA